MTTIRIDPYGLHSKASKVLSKHTGILRATRPQVRKHGTFDTIINWGNSERRFENARYINNPEAVAIASNKLSTARAFSDCGISQPQFTTSKEEAISLRSAGRDIFCRTLLRASQGRGLRLFVAEGNGGGDGDGVRGRGGERGRMVDAPMYTVYEKKADEYRVHVFDSEVIDIQQKRKRREIPNEEVNYQIRNSHNGWVYCRDGVCAPPSVIQLAVDAVSSLGLDFGAADIGYNRHEETAVVYEVNTAPGLEGSTIGFYARAIERKLPFTQGGAYRRRRAQC